MLRKNKSKYVGLLAVSVAFFLLPLYVKDTYFLHVLIMICFNAIFAMGQSFIAKMGFTSFGHGAYAGIGAYTAVLSVIRFGLPFWLAFLLSGAVALIISFLFARVTLGLRRVYFAITTFALAEILIGIYTNFHTSFGGAGGISSIPHPAGIETHAQYYYFSLTLMVITYIVLFRLSTSRFGMLCDGLNQSESLEESVGIDTRQVRIVTFVVACTFAGLAGCIMAFFLTAINPNMFGVHLSTHIIIYAVVGGLASITGAVVGAALLTVVGQLLYELGALTSLVFGAILIITVVFIPGGLAHAPWRRAASIILNKRKAVR